MIRALEAVEAELLVAGSRHNWQLSSVAPVPMNSFLSLVLGGAALFLAIGATLPSLGGSVAVAYQAIGRTFLQEVARYVWPTLCMEVLFRLSPTSQLSLI